MKFISINIILNIIQLQSNIFKTCPTMTVNTDI